MSPEPDFVAAYVASCCPSSKQKAFTTNPKSRSKFTRNLVHNWTIFLCSLDFGRKKMINAELQRSQEKDHLAGELTTTNPTSWSKSTINPTIPSRFTRLTTSPSKFKTNPKFDLIGDSRASYFCVSIDDWQIQNCIISTEVEFVTPGGSVKFLPVV